MASATMTQRRDLSPSGQAQAACRFMVRTLENYEITDLLNRDTVARLATIDADGYPHVTPIWFTWVDGAFYLTSYTGRPHLSRIRENPRVGLVIDIEDELRADGERPNQQIRVTGDATISPDTDDLWTTRIRTKYIDQAIAPGTATRRNGRERAVITVRPRTTTAVASI